MKRISIALAMIGLSSSLNSFAAFPAANDPTLINIPELSGGFFAGFSANFLQPAATNGDLDYVVVNSGAAPNFHSQLKTVDPKYAWGWGINVGYIFPHTGNDVGFNYFHFEEDNGNFVTSNVSTALNIVNPNGVLDGNINNYANASPEYDIDQVDVWGGQYINIGCRLIAHPYTGLRWAQLERDIDGTYLETSSIDGTIVFANLATQERSNFNGIGPILGLDASYYLAYGFGVVGHFDGALLAGSIDSHINTTTSVSSETVPPAVILIDNFSNDDTVRVVPVGDAKLGLDYTYMFYNKSNSDLTLEAGWQFTKYFNAVDRTYIQGTVPLSATAVVSQHKTSSVGFNGPYVYLVFHI